RSNRARGLHARVRRCDATGDGDRARRRLRRRPRHAPRPTAEGGRLAGTGGRRMRRALSLGAIAGPILFTAGWAILGLVSPGYTLWDLHIEPYSAVSPPVRGLGIG